MNAEDAEEQECPDCGGTVVPVTCSDHPTSPQCPVCGYCDECAAAPSMI